MVLININARSLANKTVELERLLFEYNPDIVIVTETWLRPEIKDCEIIPPAYNMIRKDRDTRGGGVAIIFKEKLRLVPMPNSPDCESVWCETELSGISCVIGAVYRPPNAPLSFLKSIQEFLYVNTSDKTRLIIAGDFNLPGIRWDKLEINSADFKHCEILFDIAFTYDLTQCVQGVTRVGPASESTLDLVFLDSRLSEYDVSIKEGISDHRLVLVSVKKLLSIKHGKKPTITCKNFSSADDVSILDYLEVSLYSIDEASDVNVLWNQFKDIINHCLHHFVPERVKPIRKYNPWINRDIIHLKRKIKRKRKNKASDRSDLRDLSRTLKHKLSAAKEKYYSETLTQFMINCPQRFWRHLSPSQNKVQYISVDGHITTDKSEITRRFNEYFHSVFTRSDKSSVHASPTPSSYEPPDMPDIVLSEQGIFSLLLDLDVKKSPGPDGIPNEFLKRYAEWVSKYLLIIFNASINQSQLPDDWLTARVTPVYKSGSKYDIENYRPISNTCTCCKILEHILSRSLFTYLESSKLIFPNQHGFRRKLSTVTQLFQTIHDFASALNESGQIDTVCLDLSKAFDLVPHAKLVMKLTNFGVNKNLVNWIKSYLTNRSQYVEIKGVKSTHLEVKSGVPQGSVLGPVLFLCYINDLANSIDKKLTVRLFADDCLIYSKISSHSDQVNLNSALQTIHEWCTKWDMKINYDKTVFARITNKTKNALSFNYELVGKELKRVTHFKYLGVTISEDLNWKTHINKLCCAAEQKLWFLRRNLKQATTKAKLTAYTTTVRPLLEYACIVWDPSKKYQSEKIEKIQRRAARFILSNFRSSDSVTAMLNKLNLPPLATRRRVARLKFLYLMHRNYFNFNTEQYLKPRLSRTVRSSHPNQLMPILTRLNTFKHSFLPNTIEDWNSLPPEITKSDSLAHFEKTLLHYIENDSAVSS